MRITRLRNVWERLAREDPYWAVLTAPDKRGNRWQIDEFFRTGETDVAARLAQVQPLCPDLAHGDVLDFGSGVGRLSQALANHFQSVTGVDIAEPMIALAAQHNRHPERVRYRHNPRSDLRLFGDDSFDFVFSLITLQHVPEPLIHAYLAEFVRVCRPLGIICFQLPTHVPPRQFTRLPFALSSLPKFLYRQWRRLTGLGASMSMTAVAPATVRAWLSSAGGELIAELDDRTTDGVESKLYLARPQRTA